MGLNSVPFHTDTISSGFTAAVMRGFAHASGHHPRCVPGRCLAGVVLHSGCVWRQGEQALSSSQATLVMHLCPVLGPRWLAHRWPFVAMHALTPAVSKAKADHKVKLSRLNGTALVLAVNASRRPRGRLRMTRFRLPGSRLYPHGVLTRWAAL